MNGSLNELSKRRPKRGEMGEIGRLRFDHFEILEIEPGPDGASHQTELAARLRCLPATRRNDAGRTHTRNSRCEHLFVNLVVLADPPELERITFIKMPGLIRSVFRLETAAK